MEEVKLNIDKDKNNSYIKLDTEEIIEFQDLNYEKELPVTNINNQTKNRIKAINQQKKLCYTKIGNTFCFLLDNKGNPKIMIGPHWPMYLCFCPFMTSIFFILFYSTWSMLNLLLKVLGVINYLLFFLSYTYIFLANPGMPTINENSFIGKPREQYKYCNECKMWVSNKKTTEHCFECNVCVEDYDHHCPWTGKCIAKNNIFFFYVFISAILFSFVYLVFALTYAGSNYEKHNKKK